MALPNASRITDIDQLQRSAERDGKTVNEQGKDNNNEDANGQNRKTGVEEQKEVREKRKRVEEEDKYKKELTVVVAVESGKVAVSVMDLLKGVQKECGVVMGCRVKGDELYEVTMADEKGKNKIKEGIRINGAMVRGRDCMVKELTGHYARDCVAREEGASGARGRERAQVEKTAENGGNEEEQEDKLSMHSNDMEEEGDV
ncbi:hypothetical protein NQZ68_040444 [Dissostichus eleginoides]|nr:hypothetical protein NQZ68_040444 [Dissostichus eleginoides]